MESYYSFMLYIMVITVTGVKGLLDLPSHHSYTELYSMIQTMNQTINQMKQNIENNNDLHNTILKLNQSVVNLENENTKLKQQMTAKSVQPIIAFEARLSHGISTLGDGQTIEYDQVVTNIGNGYDTRHGHFTAPVNGVYLFAVSAMAEPNEALQLFIVKNGTPVGYVRSGLVTRDYESGTTVMPMSLVAGDMIWIRHDSSTLRKIHGNGWNKFSGVLIATL